MMSVDAYRADAPPADVPPAVPEPAGGPARVEFAGPPMPPRRPGPPPGPSSGRRGRASRRTGRRSNKTLLVVATASALAVGTGVAIDRLVLPEMRSEPAATTGGTTSPAPPAPGTDLDRQRDAGNFSAPATPAESPPSLKALPDRTESKTPSPETSEPDSPDTNKPEGGGGGDGGAAPGSSAAETRVTLLTNKERAKEGCKPLRVDARLVAAARAHSKDMAANGYFSHTSQNGDSPWKRMEDAGYPSPGAENIAKGYSSPAAVVEGWMRSPGHRANILNCDLKAVGVGKAKGSGGPYWTQNFGWE